MKYEISKVINDESGKKLFTTLAWTDNKVYAHECAEGLALLNGCEYAVCVDGQPVEE